MKISKQIAEYICNNYITDTAELKTRHDSEAVFIRKLIVYVLYNYYEIEKNEIRELIEMSRQSLDGIVARGDEDYYIEKKFKAAVQETVISLRGKGIEPKVRAKGRATPICIYTKNEIKKVVNIIADYFGTTTYLMKEIDGNDVRDWRISNAVIYTCYILDKHYKVSRERICEYINRSVPSINNYIGGLKRKLLIDKTAKKELKSIEENLNIFNKAEGMKLI